MSSCIYCSSMIDQFLFGEKIRHFAEKEFHRAIIWNKSPSEINLAKKTKHSKTNYSTHLIKYIPSTARTILFQAVPCNTG